MAPTRTIIVKGSSHLHLYQYTTKWHNECPQKLSEKRGRVSFLPFGLAEFHSDSKFSVGIWLNIARKLCES